MSGLNLNPSRVAKTFKLFIDGKFVRTESGRTYPVTFFKEKQIYAHLCLASKKDVKDAVEAAKKAFDSFSQKTAYLRSQLLYRAAEMFEGKRTEFAEIMRETMGLSHEQAEVQIEGAISGLIYYAGFCDKFSQIVGAINPVAGPHHCVTLPEPLGVVGLLSSDQFDLTETISKLAALLCSGNSVVTVLSKGSAALIGPLSEVFATSDIPAGVVNLLSGSTQELSSTLATHMDIDGLCDLSNDAGQLSTLKVQATSNMKRVHSGPTQTLSLESVTDFIEYKTIWHPIGK